MMRIVGCILFFFVSYGFYAQNITLNKGQVNQGLKVGDSTGSTYALYIPASFNTETPSKILYVFDPEGDGVRVSRLFMAAIQRDDFVIVANEFPLTDDLESNLSKILKLMDRTMATIKVDPSQIYVAGLDQGAKAASGLTYIISNLAGVLLINDLFIRYDLPVREKKEIVLGLVGNASANYYKMNAAFDRLHYANKDNKLYEYDGEGGWPRLDYLGTLFNTLYFLHEDAFKKSLPDAFVDQSFKQDSITVNALVQRQDYLIAYDLITQLKDKYRGMIKLRPLRHRIQQLRRNPGYRKQRDEVNSDAEDEALLLDDLDYYFDNDLFLASFENLGYWDDRIKQFKEAATNTAKPYEQQVAKRMLGFVNNTLQDYGMDLATRKLNANQLIFYYVLRTVVNPKDYEAYKMAISLAAKDQDKNTALFYLEEMLKNGYVDYDAIYTIPNTEVLRISPVYNQIVAKYLGRAMY